MAHNFTKAHRSSPWLFIALGAVVVLSIGTINPVQAQRFCGKVLTDTLTTYCELFPTLAPSTKRSHGQTIEGTNYREFVQFPNVPIVDERDMVGIINHKPNWMKAVFSRKDDFPVGEGDDFTGLMIPDRFQLKKRQTGVVYDCCYKPCSLNYLLSNYCGVIAG